MKKRISSLPVLAFLVSFATLSLLTPTKSLAYSISVTLPVETTVQTGSEHTIPISIIGAQDLGALQFELVFNEDILEVVDVARGSGVPPVLIDYHIIAPGLLRFALAGSEPIEGDARIELRVLGLAEGSGTIELIDPKAWALGTGFELLVESTPGMVTVTAGLPFSGILIIAAALLLLVVLIALITLIIRRRKKKALGKPENKTVPPQTGQRPQAPPSNKRFCQQCGQQLPVSVAFCDQCGTRV